MGKSMGSTVDAHVIMPSTEPQASTPMERVSSSMSPSRVMACGRAACEVAHGRVRLSRARVARDVMFPPLAAAPHISGYRCCSAPCRRQRRRGRGCPRRLRTECKREASECDDEWTSGIWACSRRQPRTPRDGDLLRDAGRDVRNGEVNAHVGLGDLHVHVHGLRAGLHVGLDPDSVEIDHVDITLDLRAERRGVRAGAHRRVEVRLEIGACRREALV